jgi:predicted permease
MLKLVVNVGLPALFLADVSRVPLRTDLVSLPLCAGVIILVSLVLSLVAGRSLKLLRPAQGALTVCSMSINNGFLFPFVIAAWGQLGFAQLALFDLGNALLQGSLVYAIAAVYWAFRPFGPWPSRCCSTSVASTCLHWLPPCWAPLVASSSCS